MEMKKPKSDVVHMENEGQSVVISLGGSVLIPGNGDAEFITKVSDLVQNHSIDKKIWIVAGGGPTARTYIKIIKELGGDIHEQDRFGILATRMNANILVHALGDSCAQECPETIEKAAELGKTNKIVVMGGTEPGHTTDAVAAMLCRRIGCKVMINATNVDGIYDKDPRKHADAARMDRIGYQQLVDIIGMNREAGQNVVFDPKAADIVMKEGITLKVVQGRDILNLEKAIEGKEFTGTVVK